MPKQSTADRRVLRTKNSLHEALAALVHERPYHSISVTDILNRANVGRSTFYTHFGDKDELLVSGIQQTLSSATARAPHAARRRDTIIGFSLPLFEHCYQRRHDAKAAIDAKARALLHDHLRSALTESIGDAVERAVVGHQETAAMSSEVLARYVASAFICVLDWWMESGCKLSAKDADDLFRALILPTLSSVFR